MRKLKRKDSSPAVDGYPIRGIYNETPARELRSGLYLGLMHGRRTPRESLNTWGDNGPIIGPLKYVHTTYAVDIHLADSAGEELESLEIVKGLVKFGGMFYGDWTVFAVPSPSRRGRIRRSR